MKHQRALDETEKNERRDQILAATAELFRSTGYEQVSMQAVAQQAGIAKGTVYLYFATKEALFLGLIDHYFADWFADLQQRLPESVWPGSTAERADRYVAALDASLEAHDFLLRLLPILHITLEHNITYAEVLGFKQRLRAQLLQTGRQMEQCLGFLQPGQGVELLLNTYAGLIGLQSMANPSPVVRQVLDLPELALFDMDSRAVLRQMVRRWLTALIIQNERTA